MDRRTVGIIATIATVLLCGLPGLCLCVFGALAAAGQPFSTTINGVPTGETNAPPGLGISLICAALILVAIPIVVAIFTLRQPRTPAGAQVYNPPTPPPTPYTPPPTPYTPPPAPYVPPVEPYVPPVEPIAPPEPSNLPPAPPPPAPEMPAEPPSEPDNPPPAPAAPPDDTLPPAI